MNVRKPMDYSARFQRTREHRDVNELWQRKAHPLPPSHTTLAWTDLAA